MANARLVKGGKVICGVPNARGELRCTGEFGVIERGPDDQTRFVFRSGWWEDRDSVYRWHARGHYRRPVDPYDPGGPIYAGVAEQPILPVTAACPHCNELNQIDAENLRVTDPRQRGDGPPIEDHPIYQRALDLHERTKQLRKSR